MTSQKISQLSDGSPAQSGDLVPIARSGNNYSLTNSSIAAYALSTIAQLPSGNPSQPTDLIPISRNGQNYSLSVNNFNSLTVANLTAVIVSLPTTLPSTSGQLWLNGGILCVS